MGALKYTCSSLVCCQDHDNFREIAGKRGRIDVESPAPEKVGARAAELGPCRCKQVYEIAHGNSLGRRHAARALAEVCVCSEAMRCHAIVFLLRFLRVIHFHNPTKVLL